jgi:hypothetical protein
MRAVLEVLGILIPVWVIGAFVTAVLIGRHFARRGELLPPLTDEQADRRLHAAIEDGEL